MALDDAPRSPNRSHSLRLGWLKFARALITAASMGCMVLPFGYENSARCWGARCVVVLVLCVGFACFGESCGCCLALFFAHVDLAFEAGEWVEVLFGDTVL